MGLQIASSLAVYPWEVRHDIVTATNAAGTFGITGAISQQLDNGFIEQTSAPAQNDEVTFKAILAPGTWTFTAICCQFTDSGIATVSVDGTAVGSLGGSASTFDLYAASLTYNVKKTLTGIVLPAMPSVGYRVVSIKAATKNASASNYRMRLSRLVWTRTA